MLVPNDSNVEKRWTIQEKVQVTAATNHFCQKILHAKHACPALEIDEPDPSFVISCCVHKVRCSVCQEPIRDKGVMLDGHPVCLKDFEVTVHTHQK